MSLALGMSSRFVISPPPGLNQTNGSLRALFDGDPLNPNHLFTLGPVFLEGLNLRGKCPRQLVQRRSAASCCGMVSTWFVAHAGALKLCIGDYAFERIDAPSIASPDPPTKMIRWLFWTRAPHFPHRNFWLTS